MQNIFYHAAIRCIGGSDKGKKWRWTFSEDTTVVIGRIAGCHIRIEDEKVSQSHCLLQVQNYRLCAVDMGSLQGTSVNGCRIAGAFPLSDGDVLAVGNSQLLLQITGGTPISVREAQQVEEGVPVFSLAQGEPSYTQSRPAKSTEHKTRISRRLDHIQKSDVELSCSFCRATSQIVRVKPCSFCPSCEQTAQFFMAELSEYTVDRLWHSSPFGVVVAVYGEEPQGKKSLLYISKPGSPEISLRVRKEAEEMMVERHPHLYPISCEKKHRERYMAFLPYLPGTFADKLEGKRAHARAIDIILNIGKALEYGVEKWGIHGEIWPGNIFIEVTGHPYLFGYGVLREVLFPSAHPLRQGNLWAPCFAAPERVAKNAAPTIASEIFSLAASLLALMTGIPVYKGRTMDQMREEAASFSPPRYHFEHALVKNFFKVALASAPQARYPGIPHFLDALSMIRCLYR